MTDKTTDESPTKPRNQRTLYIALAVSLALNLLVIGVLVGARLAGGPPHGAMLNNSAFSVGRAIRQFDEPRRDELWPIARPHFRGLGREIRNLRKAQTRWERAYRADPIDFAELDQSHEHLNAQVKAIQHMNFAALRALADELSPAERHQLLQALRAPRGPRGHRSGHRPQEPAPTAQGSPGP